MHFVVIGNGVAGINAANQIRARDAAAEITIISQESDHFFSRTALMYVFSGQMTMKDIEPFERDLYNRMDFRRVRDTVQSIDHRQKLLRLDRHDPISYDRLLIACGSVARMVGTPGEELDGVCNFVTLRDLECLEHHARTARRAVVIGGGLIGIEVAEILLERGIDTSFIIRESWFWPIALDQAESDVVCSHMKHHGCQVFLNTECREILGDNGRVVGIETKDDRTIECDLVVFAIGVRPGTDWLAGSGFELDGQGGIVVNDNLQTSLPDIYAAGDCTSVVWFNDVRRPEQLWYTSRDQGRVAGLNMAGDKRVYKRGTFYNSAKFFDLEYTTAGYVNFNFADERNWFQREPGRNYTTRITYLPDESVIGFNFIGRRWDHRPLVRWVEEKRPLGWVLEHLHEANFDEELMPRFRVLNNPTGVRD